MGALTKEEKAKLGDFVEMQKGFAFKSDWYCDHGQPIVKVSNFTSDSIDNSNLVKIPFDMAIKYKKYELKEGDVVIQTVGSWPSNPASVVGKCIRVPRELNNTLLNQNAVRLKPVEGLDNDFLYYTLRTSEYSSYIVGTAQGAASQAAITLDAIRSYKLYHPPLPTQEKIAAILSAYDGLIENNLRRIKILEEMAQNLYREWFVNFRFPGHEKACFVDSPLGRIPEGWEIKTLGEMADQIRKGINPKSIDSVTPYVGLEHLPRKSITLLSWGFANEVQSMKYEFKKGDILFGKIRPYFHKVAVAPLSGICSSDTIVIRIKAGELFGLVLGCTSSSEFVEYATATSQGTKMPRANWDVLIKYQIPVPSQPILKCYNEFIDNITRQLCNYIFRNINLRQTRDLLLPKLISGEVDVSELDIKVQEEVSA
jgi:type I restriction enzyme, S subunit